MIKHEESTSNGSAGRKTGTVKWFDDKKGYGFLANPEGGEDIFVHFSCIESKGYRSLEEGMRVEFAIDELPAGGRGLRAKNVLPIDPPAQRKAKSKRHHS